MNMTLLSVLAQVSAKPDANGLPGSNQAEQLVNGLFFYTLLACLAGLLISVIVWVFASRSQNYHHASNLDPRSGSRVEVSAGREAES